MNGQSFCRKIFAIGKFYPRAQLNPPLFKVVAGGCRQSLQRQDFSGRRFKLKQAFVNGRKNRHPAFGETQRLGRVKAGDVLLNADDKAAALARRMIGFRLGRNSAHHQRRANAGEGGLGKGFKRTK